MKNGYTVLIAQPEGKRPLARLERRWQCNIKLDLKKIKGAQQ
jgi:hypothetical protein